MFRFGDPGGRIYTSVGTSNVNVLAHWSNFVNTFITLSVSAGNGRLTGSCLRFTDASTSQSGYLTKTLDSQATWGCAFAYKQSVINTACILAFWDNSTTQIELRVNSDGTFSITRNGTVLGTTTIALASGTWIHLELKVTIHPSAGTVAFYVNGIQKLNLTSQNTRNSSNSSANIVALGNISHLGNGANDYDDIIVYDAQTTDANGFTDIVGPIGDCGLGWILPTGAGTTTQFTPDSGTNFSRVNEATPDGDTSYVSDVTIGHIDTYVLADVAASVSSIKTLATIHYIRKDDVGSRGIKGELRSAVANVSHATEFALGNNYQYYFSNWGQNPNNGSPIDWTPTTVNSLEAGQTVSS